MDDLIARALHAARHHFAGGGLLSGPDYLSTGEEVSPTNWGNPDVASDFFKADKALRLAREIQAKADSEASRLPIPERAVQEAPALPRAALRVAAEPSPQMAMMLARAEMTPDKIEDRVAPEANAVKIAERATDNADKIRADDIWNRMLKQESGGRQFDKYGRTITSPAGALGISQVIPSTGPEAARLAGLPWSLERLRTDPEYNHALGRAYYDAQLAKFGDPILAAAAYNGGPGRISQALVMAQQTGRPWTAFLKPETQNYVRIVGRAEGGEVENNPDEVEQALAIARRQPMTPASLANAWTPPEESIAQNVGPRAAQFMQEYPEKLAAGIAAAPEAIAHHFVETGKYPGELLYGERAYNPEEAIKKAQDMAGMILTGGVGGASAAAGETVLGSGPVRKALDIATQQRELSPMGLYSHGAESAMGLPQAKGTPEQMAAMLQARGVKPEEMFASGFADEAKTAAMRSKLEAEFTPKVEAAQKAMEGLTPGTPEFKAAERQFKNISSTMRSEMDRALVLGDEWASRPSVTREEAAQFFKERMPQVEETVLGGKSKVDFTPEMERRLDELTEKRISTGLTEEEMAEKNKLFGLQEEAASGRSRTKFGEYTLPGGENYREVLLKLPEEGTGQSFKSQHWDDPNVLAHMRMADRTGPNGEKILHVEEIQSDWGQKGKKGGFWSSEKQAKQDEANAQLREFNKNLRDQYEQELINKWNQSPIIARSRAAQQSPAALSEMFNVSDQYKNLLQEATIPVKSKIPSAPYVTSTQGWTDLALKRALKEAAEGGYDKLVWTPGAEQAKRYSLSNTISKIGYDPKSGELYALDRSGAGIRQLQDRTFKPNELSNVIGKDVTEKLFSTEPNANGLHVLNDQEIPIGGEGMKGYYDKIVPAQLQKLLKKLDPEAKVGMTDVVLPPKSGIGHNNPPLEAPGITITPTMRENILKGMPHMADGGSIVDRALEISRKG